MSKSVLVCVCLRLCISRSVYVSWGLYVFLNEIDVGYIYGGKAALCTGQMEWAVLHTNLNGLISTVLKGGVVVKMVYYDVFAHPHI